MRGQIQISQLEPGREVLRLDHVTTRSSRIRRIYTNTHIETSRDHLLWRAEIASRQRCSYAASELLRVLWAQNFPLPQLRRIQPSNICFTEHVKHAVLRVVPAVHGLVHAPPEAPRQTARHVREEPRQRRQRFQNFAHKFPAHLKPLDGIPMPDVLGEHDHQLSLKTLRMPGHLEARLQPLHTLNEFLVTSMVILYVDSLHTFHASYGAWEHQMSLLVRRERLPIWLCSVTRKHR